MKYIRYLAESWNWWFCLFENILIMMNSWLILICLCFLQFTIIFISQNKLPLLILFSPNILPFFSSFVVFDKSNSILPSFSKNIVTEQNPLRRRKMIQKHLKGFIFMSTRNMYFFIKLILEFNYLLMKISTNCR